MLCIYAISNINSIIKPGVMATFLTRNILETLKASLVYGNQLYRPAPLLQQAVRSQHQSTEKTCNDSAETDAPLENMKNPFERPKAVCILCKYKITPDYKNYKLLSQFQSPYTGRVYSKNITGLCSAKQRKVEMEISKAENAGYMAAYLKEPCFLKDPRLFDPEKPLRPHKY